MGQINEQQKARIVEAIADCDRFIEKEGARDAALRPADVAATLVFYRAHKAKLQNMLAGA